MEELSKSRQILSSALRLALRGGAAFLILSALGGLLAFSFWSFVQWGRDRLEAGIEIEQVQVRSWGLTMPRWSVLRLDSLRVALPARGITVLAYQGHLQVRPAAWPQDTAPTFATLSLGRLSVELDTSVHVPPDTTSPRWPVPDLPASVSIRVDTVDLRLGRRLRLLGVEARADGRTRLQASLRKASSHGIPIDLSVQAKADWSTRDSVRLEAGGRFWGGCCSNDTFALEATLLRPDLRRGRASLELNLADAQSWSDMVPALHSAPKIGRIRLKASGSNSAQDTALALLLETPVQPFFPLPGGEIRLEASANRSGTRLSARWQGRDAFLIHARIASKRTPSQWSPDMALDGKIDVQAWNMLVGGHALPLDAVVDVLKVDRHGAQVVARMKTGSVIRGSSTFRPLGWKLDADLVSAEPWTHVWLPGLRIDSGAHVRGYDSAHGTAFEILARHPHWAPAWGRIEQDTVEARLWLNTKHVLFERIQARQAGRVLAARGEVNWTDWFWRFEASPERDSSSYVQVRGSIVEKDVQAQIGDFPLEILPLSFGGNPPLYRMLPRLVKSSIRLTGGFVHRPDGTSSFDWASGRLRAKPSDDSLVALFDFTHVDSTLQLRNLGVHLGPDHLRASLVGHVGATSLQLDTLALDLDSIHLDRVMRLIDPNSAAGGVLKGTFRSGPTEGLSAQARLEEGWIQQEDGSRRPLPTLLLWGRRDTLNVGGFWPLKDRRIPFKASVTRLFDARRDFRFLAFPEELMRVRAQGSVDSLKRAHLDFDIAGDYSLGDNGLLRGLSARGTAKAWKEAGGWKWNATAASDSGARFLGPEGNAFALAFKARATPEFLTIDTASLAGKRGGSAGFRARYDLQRSKLQIDGHVDRLRLGIGPSRNLSIAAADITSTEDGILHANLTNASFRERYGKGEELVARIRDGQLHFQSAKDWNKVTGNIQVASARYTKSIPVADPTNLFRSQAATRKEAAKPVRSAAKPLLLSLSVSSIGDSIVLDNNLARARLSFNADVGGTSASPVLTGFVSASDSNSSFQYAGKVFKVEQFRVDWAAQDLMQGKYELTGSRQIRHACAEEETDAADDASDVCAITLTSKSTLSNPQMQLDAKACAKDASAQATLQALLLGCYPQSQAGQGIQVGSVASALGVGLTKTWVNDVINDRLKGRKDPGWAFLPDSMKFKELPRENAGTQDKMIVAGGWKLGERFDIEAEYAHVFAASKDNTIVKDKVVNAATSNSVTDDYSLRLRYHPPFDWVDDSVSRTRLEQRVILQVETSQSKGWIPGKETLLKPSIRYRWEFW